MGKKICENGHYYDPDIFSFCPFCHTANECPNGQHKFIMDCQTGDYDYYRCRICGKIIRECAWEPHLYFDSQYEHSNALNRSAYNISSPIEIKNEDERIFVNITQITHSYLKTYAEQWVDVNKAYNLGEIYLKVIRCDDEFAQIDIFAHRIAQNTKTKKTFLFSFDNIVKRIGIKYDSPVLINAHDYPSDAICSYIIIAGKKVIKTDDVKRLTGINFDKNFNKADYLYTEKRITDVMRISDFQELMHYFDTHNNAITQNNYTVKNTKIYKEGYYSSKNPHKRGRVIFHPGKTLDEVHKLAKQNSRTTVLSFANPVNPGGGILSGADSQEQSLCRASNLYKSLTSDEARIYYEENKRIQSKNQFNSIYIGTDMVLYSPNVYVVKYENEYLKAPYYIDVITCAAPFFSGSGYMIPNGDLQHLFERRIRNIFETAIENEADNIILGAWGCGTFNNPPQIVADAFRAVLLEQRYRNAFETILFVVKRTNSFCPINKAFETNFSDFPDISCNCNERMHSY